MSRQHRMGRGVDAPGDAQQGTGLALEDAQQGVG